jgi:serine/threonine protein kinase
MPSWETTEEEAIPKPGELVAGKFRIEGILGRGGMGHVLAARHELLEQRVAVKVMRSSHTVRADAVERFFNEARAAARIESEHIARALDVGKLDDGRPYFVMEFLEGKDLGGVLQSRTAPLPIDETVDLVLEVLDGLAQAHAEGVIHRDLKPSNIFLAKRRDGSDVIKILDFGICKLHRPGVSDLTATQAGMGSPLYMSPEQTRNAKNVDARTDIWSIGTVLYELLTRKLAFDAETYGELCSLIFEGKFEPARHLRPEIPEALDAIIARCLKVAPGDRFASAGELGLTLAAHGTGKKSVNVERLRARASAFQSHLAAPAPAAPSKPDIAPTEMPLPAAATEVDVAAHTAQSWTESQRQPASQGALHQNLRRWTLKGLAAASLLGMTALALHWFAPNGERDRAPEAASAPPAVPTVAAAPPAASTIAADVTPPDAGAMTPAPAVSTASKHAATPAARASAVVKPHPAVRPKSNEPTLQSTRD